MACAALTATRSQAAGPVAHAQRAGPVAGAQHAGPVAHAAKVGPAPISQPLALVLPLVSDLAGLERFARAVTTPGSPRYGHYESIARLAERFGASAAVRSSVVRYLRRAGARSVRIDATGLFADATITAGVAQRLFGAPLAQFHSRRGGRFVAPVARAKVPAALRGMVTGVVGLDTEPLATAAGSAATRSARAAAVARQAAVTRQVAVTRQAAVARPAAVTRQAAVAHQAAAPSSVLPHTGTAGGCAEGQQAGELDADPRTAGFTPNQYLTAYGFGGLYGSGYTGQGERVALIEIDGFNLGDIEAFAHCFGLGTPPIHAFGVGTGHALAPGGESTLDLEVLDAAAPGLTAIDVYETKPNASTTLRALTAPLQNRGHHPQVISASLGLCELQVLAAVGINGIEATEGALAMAAASGITVLASSGDQGSADCTGQDGLPLRRLAVNYPASSPWVTAVGGTNVVLNATNQITGQIVWNDGSDQPGSAAGGGVSNLFKRPRYQNGVVRTKARALPDVSLLADIVPGFAVYCSALDDCVNAENSNAWQSVGGTSAATPLLAGGLALVDQALRMHARVDLGLVNPLLYTIGRSASLDSGVFSDVLHYDNDVGPFIGGGRPLGCCSAHSGFDFASGWGSMNIAGFAYAAVLLQPAQFGLSLPPGQRPVRRRELLATVTCAGACRIGAYAQIRIGKRGKPFEVDSAVHQLAGPGSNRISLPFSKAQLLRLRRGLRHHDRVVATVFGVAVKGRRTIQARTGGIRLPIRG